MFLINKPRYDAIVREVNAGHCSESDLSRWAARVYIVHCGSPAILVIPWGAAAGGWHGVIYDTTDGISRPLVQRSFSWLSSDVGRVLQNSGVDRDLGGHYYLGGGYF